MTRKATAGSAVGLIFVISCLAGCAAGETAQPVTSEVARAFPAEPDDAPTTETPRPPAATPSMSATTMLQQIDYETMIAAWPEPPPPGYSWPAWLDLPHIDPLGNSQLGQADNASGVYRCILIDAAWHAYFEANDPGTSKDYAIRDNHVIPGNPSIRPVTQDGVIVDRDLAASNGICRGIAGDLEH